MGAMVQIVTSQTVFVYYASEKQKLPSCKKYEKLLKSAFQIYSDSVNFINWRLHFNRGMNAEIRNPLPKTAISGQPEQKMSKRAYSDHSCSFPTCIVEIQCNPDLFRRDELSVAFSRDISPGIFLWLGDSFFWGKGKHIFKKDIYTGQRCASKVGQSWFARKSALLQ